MSVTLSKLRRSDALAKLHLRTPDGTVHGPLSIADLCKWATQNRIPPGSKVSEDKDLWTPAEVIEELKLEWDAKCGDGRVTGPYNLLAVPLLVQDGTLEAADVLVNRVSNRSVQVRDLLKTSNTIVRKAADAQNRSLFAYDPADPSQRELFGQSAPNSGPPLPAYATPAEGTRKTAGSRETEGGSQVARLKEAIARGNEQISNLTDAFEQEKLRHAETRRLNESDAKFMKERIRSLEAEQAELSSKLADALRDSDAVRQDDEALKSEVQEVKHLKDRIRELETSQHDLLARPVSGQPTAEVAKVKAALDQEKSHHAETLRQKEQDTRQFRDRIKILETEQRDLSARLAMAVQAAEKTRQSDETLKVGMRSKEAELARRGAELEKALNNSAAETARVKAALEQEKLLHAELRRTTADREQQASGRIKELEIEGRTLASRLSQAVRSFEDVTQKHDALQLESRRRDEESVQRIEQLEKALSASSAEIAKLKADQDYEKTLHVETRRLAAEKEKQSAGRIKALEGEAKELSAQLAAAVQLAADARQKDEALQSEARKKDSDIAQRVDQLRRSLEARVADVSRLKAELDREKALHAETRRLDGEREQQLVSRAKELEIKARDAAARMAESIQLAEERKRKYESVQKESRQKESELIVNAEQFQKSAEAAAKAVREIQQKMEEEQLAHAQVQKEWWKKEQELTERLARMETDTGSLSGMVAQARIEAEKQKSQEQVLIEQGKAREMQLTQRLNQLQSEHEQTVIALDQARKKLAEKRLGPAPAPDPAVSEREKRLTISLTQMEKQVEGFKLQAEQSKAETERLRRELVRTGERLTAAEKEARERIGELERTAQTAMQATEAARKAGEEQGRMCRKLTEENASLNSRIPGLQAENQKVAESAKAALAELAAIRRQFEDAAKALAKERSQHEAAMESARAEHVKLEARLYRMMQEPARVEERRERRRGLVVTASIAAGAGVVALLVGIGLGHLIAEPPAGTPAQAAQIAVAKPAVPVPVVPTNLVQKPVAAAVTSAPVARVAVVAPTGAVQAVEVAPSPVSKWPDIAVERLIVTRTDKAAVIVFSYGAFASLANLREEAKADLGAVADQLRTKMGEFSLVVVGYTDTVPVSTNAALGGNYELGMVRARAAAEYLVKQCNLPGASVIAVSAGGTPNTPYPNGDAESRKKNRTVVIRLVPAWDAARVKGLYKNPTAP